MRRCILSSMHISSCSTSPKALLAKEVAAESPNFPVRKRKIKTDFSSRARSTVEHSCNGATKFIIDPPPKKKHIYVCIYQIATEFLKRPNYARQGQLSNDITISICSLPNGSIFLSVSQKKLNDPRDVPEVTVEVFTLPAFGHLHKTML